MSKHKNKIVVAVFVIVMLSGAWILGGVPTINHPTPSDEIYLNVEGHIAAVGAESYLDTLEYEIDSSDEEYEYYDEYDEPEEYESEDDECNESDEEPDEHSEEDKPEETNELECDDESDETDEQVEPNTPVDPPAFDYIPQVANADRFAQTPEGVILPDISPSSFQVFAADHPAMRAPVEPENMVIGDDAFTVTISVRAHTILYNMHLLHRDKHELVPEDGWILPPTVVVAYEGESVFNVLQREMRRNRIHMVSRWTPIFNSAYVEAINNLYEFDVGPLSGWMYSVNGWFPNFGASRYLLSDGDVIEWLYTVDLGRDLGVLWLGGE